MKSGLDSNRSPKRSKLVASSRGQRLRQHSDEKRSHRVIKAKVGSSLRGKKIKKANNEKQRKTAAGFSNLVLTT
jgi:hypothetical protein